MRRALVLARSAAELGQAEIQATLDEVEQLRREAAAAALPATFRDARAAWEAAHRGRRTVRKPR
jgi:hypothetical protein